MKQLLFVSLFIATLSSMCTDKYCLSCTNNVCSGCALRYLDANQMCMAPTTAVANCLMYSSAT